MRLAFWVPGKPAGYSRSAARWGALPEPNRLWRQAVAAAFQVALADAGLSGIHDKGAVTLGPVVFHGSRCDLDNLEKELLDALNGVAYRDDSQINKVTEKTRGMDPHHEPGAHVTLTFTDDDPFPKKPPKPRAKKARKAA